MAARARAMPLQIADALARVVRDHATFYPARWSAVPYLVARGMRTRYANERRPLVIVESRESTEVELGTGPTHRTRRAFKIWCLTQDQYDPEAAIVELVADVRRALDSGRQLEDAEGAPLANVVRVVDQGDDCDAEPPGEGGGLGQGVINLAVDYGWSADTA